MIKKILKMGAFYLGTILILFSVYIAGLERYTKNEINQMKYGTLNYFSIQKYINLPFFPKDVFEYNTTHFIEKTGDKTVAKKRYDMLLESKSKEIRFWSYIRIGTIFYHSGEIMMAYEKYREAIRIYPDNLYAKILLERLFTKSEKKGKTSWLSGDAEFDIDEGKEDSLGRKGSTHSKGGKI